MEIVVILLIYLLLFGAKGVPTLARSLGTAMRQVRAATDEIQREILSSANDVQSEVRSVRRATEAVAREATAREATAGPAAEPVKPAAEPVKPAAGAPGEDPSGAERGEG